VRTVVLQPTMTGGNGGGGPWWPELMVEVACAVVMVVTTFVHVGGAPTHISFGLISSESV
jgi:hypothetical protein